MATDSREKEKHNSPLCKEKYSATYLAKDAFPSHDSLYGDLTASHGHLNVGESRLLALGAMQY